MGNVSRSRLKRGIEFATAMLALFIIVTAILYFEMLDLAHASIGGSLAIVIVIIYFLISTIPVKRLE